MVPVKEEDLVVLVEEDLLEGRVEVSFCFILHLRVLEMILSPQRLCLRPVAVLLVNKFFNMEYKVVLVQQRVMGLVQ